MKLFCVTIVLLLGLALCLAGCAGSSAKVPQMPRMPTADSPAVSALPASAPAASEDNTPTGTIIEPKQLISKQDAEQLLGEAVKEGEKSEQPATGQKICFYYAQNEDSLSFLQISITQTAFMKSSSQTPESIVVSRMVGREIGDMYPEKSGKAPGGPPLFEVRNFSDGIRFSNICFELREGEILGLAGLVGAGRSEVAQAICGLRKKISGEVYYKGEKININSPKDATTNGIVYLTEDRKTLGLFLELSIKANISSAAQA